MIDLPIEHLDLAGFLNITDEGAKYIAGMKHLRYLSLDGTEVTDEGIMLFKSMYNGIFPSSSSFYLLIFLSRFN